MLKRIEMKETTINSLQVPSIPPKINLEKDICTQKCSMVSYIRHYHNEILWW